MSTNPSAFVATPATIGAATASAVAWQPSDQGWLAACGPLEAFLNASTGAITAGTLYLIKVPLRSFNSAVSNVIFGVQTAAAGASTQTFAGIYNPSGTLIQGSADVGAQFTAAPQAAVCPLSATVPAATLQPLAFVWAALITNFATTQPSLYRSGGAGTLALTNAGLTAATFRAATNGTVLTALPASITPASNSTTGALPMFAALS